MAADQPTSTHVPYPLQHALGYDITCWEKDFARVEMPIQDIHTNAHGLPHGGVYAVLLDTAAAFAGTWRPDPEPNANALTLSLNINFVGLAQSGRLIAEGRRVGGGKSIFFSEAELRDDAGGLVATATAVLRYRNSTGDPVKRAAAAPERKP